MASREFLTLYGTLLGTMLLCRCLPLFALRGKSLPERAADALGLIPAAAFAALVANDLVQPAVIATDAVQGLLPFAAALPVFAVAKRTGSLLGSALTGLAAYAALLLLTGAL